MGEISASSSLIRELLARGEKVLITCMVPDGREKALRLFSTEAEAGRMRVRYQPLEYDFAWRRFLKTSDAPKYLLILEFDLWPLMILSALRNNIPVYLCNTRCSPEDPMKDRPLQKLRFELLKGISGAFAKSEIHGTRLRSFGVPEVHVTGELRFDEPVPAQHTEAAATFSKDHGLDLSEGRPVITLASVMKGEDKIYFRMMKAILEAAAKNGTHSPLFVYVPRAPERFEEVATSLAQTGTKFVRRSRILDANLAAVDDVDLNSATVLLGDSIGEMPFYLSLANIVVIGGGFTQDGAHNIIEALVQKKVVMVGPRVEKTEYPVFEAIENGVLIKMESAPALTEKITLLLDSPGTIAAIGNKAAEFHAHHSGGTARTLSAIDAVHSRIVNGAC